MKKIVATSLTLSLILVAHTYNRFRDGAESTSGRRLVIEIAPLEQGGGQWKIAASDTVTATVTAPGVERVQILGRPVGVEEDYLDLRTLTAPTCRESGKFVTQLNLAPDFAGRQRGDLRRGCDPGHCHNAADAARSQMGDGEERKPDALDKGLT